MINFVKLTHREIQLWSPIIVLMGVRGGHGVRVRGLPLLPQELRELQDCGHAPPQARCTQRASCECTEYARSPGSDRARCALAGKLLPICTPHRRRKGASCVLSGNPAFRGREVAAAALPWTLAPSRWPGRFGALALGSSRSTRRRPARLGGSRARISRCKSSQ